MRGPHPDASPLALTTQAVKQTCDTSTADATLAVSDTQPDELGDTSTSLPPTLNDAMEAYNDSQEVSFTYETFLQEQCNEYKHEMETLRQSNETLVQDFADLLASYKDVVQTLNTNKASTPLASPLMQSLMPSDATLVS